VWEIWCKIHASEIIRNVRERRVRYVITYHGRPVGLLLPLEQPIPEASTDTDQAATAAAWDELTRLGEEIGKGWRSPLSSTDLLTEMRR
jgi:antitoxin (DNA-binding transcriptional repressor) of toxin-antitoxin stability system